MGWEKFRVSCSEFLVIELETSNSKLETNQPKAKTFDRPWHIARWKEELRNPDKDRSNVRNLAYLALSENDQIFNE